MEQRGRHLQGYTKIENRECERKVTKVCHENLHCHLYPLAYSKKYVEMKENTEPTKFAEVESYVS